MATTLLSSPLAMPAPAPPAWSPAPEADGGSSPLVSGAGAGLCSGDLGATLSSTQGALQELDQSFGSSMSISSIESPMPAPDMPKRAEPRAAPGAPLEPDAFSAPDAGRRAGDEPVGRAARAGVAKSSPHAMEISSPAVESSVFCPPSAGAGARGAAAATLSGAGARAASPAPAARTADEERPARKSMPLLPSASEFARYSLADLRSARALSSSAVPIGSTSPQVEPPNKKRLSSLRQLDDVSADEEELAVPSRHKRHFSLTCTAPSPAQGAWGATPAAPRASEEGHWNDTPAASARSRRTDTLPARVSPGMAMADYFFDPQSPEVRMSGAPHAPTLLDPDATPAAPDTSRSSAGCVPTSPGMLSPSMSPCMRGARGSAAAATGSPQRGTYGGLAARRSFSICVPDEAQGSGPGAPHVAQDGAPSVPRAASPCLSLPTSPGSPARPRPAPQAGRASGGAAPPAVQVVEGSPVRMPSRPPVRPLGMMATRSHTSAMPEDRRRAAPTVSPGMPGFGSFEMDSKVLPCFPVKNDGLMRIEPATLADLLRGRYADQIHGFRVVDCRFAYEYEGGHIAGATNLNTVEQVRDYFLRPGVGLHERSSCLPTRTQSGTPDEHGDRRKFLLIFHCEFSCKRAPSMALALRQADRALAHDYPNCHFPDVYVLQGGYNDFFHSFPELCEPRAYVGMDDPRFVQRRSVELTGFRKQFSRNRSYAYGDQRSSSTAVNILAANRRMSIKRTVAVTSTVVGRAAPPEKEEKENAPPAGAQQLLPSPELRPPGRPAEHAPPSNALPAADLSMEGKPDASFGSTGDSSFDADVGDSPCAAAGRRQPALMPELPAGKPQPPMRPAGPRSFGARQLKRADTAPVHALPFR